MGDAATGALQVVAACRLCVLGVWQGVLIAGTGPVPASVAMYKLTSFCCGAGASVLEIVRLLCAAAIAMQHISSCLLRLCFCGGFWPLLLLLLPTGCSDCYGHGALQCPFQQQQWQY